MKVGKSYTLAEFLAWTRRKIYVLLVLAIIPVILYQLLGQKWVAMPWPVVAMLGTAASFIVGFKNAQTYNRTAGGPAGLGGHRRVLSRYWGADLPGLPDEPEVRKSSFTVIWPG